MPPGPPPKRSAERRRRNKRDIDSIELAEPVVEAPEPADDWHPLALRWFELVKDSIVARFYEPSDWAMVLVIAESISRELKPQPVAVAGQGIEYVSKPPTAAALSAWLRASGSLMLTEGDRRRFGIEVQRGVAEIPDEVTSLDDYRDQIAQG